MSAQAIVVCLTYFKPPDRNHEMVLCGLLGTLSSFACRTSAYVILHCSAIDVPEPVVGRTICPIRIEAVMRARV